MQNPDITASGWISFPECKVTAVWRPGTWGFRVLARVQPLCRASAIHGLPKQISFRAPGFKCDMLAIRCRSGIKIRSRSLGGQSCHFFGREIVDPYLSPEFLYGKCHAFSVGGDSRTAIGMGGSGQCQLHAFAIHPNQFSRENLALSGSLRKVRIGAKDETGDNHNPPADFQPM